MNENKHIKPLQIGKIKISHNVIMAPLAGVSDYPFRELVRSFGAQLTFTEMISVNAYLQQPKKTIELLKIREHEHPLGIQLMGNDPEDFKRIIPEIEAYRPDIIDINFGCPVKKVLKTGGGALLLKDADKIFQIIKTSVETATIPIMAKIRLGWEDKTGLAEIVKAVVEGGASALTLHGRTQRQAYTGEVDLKAMAEVKALSKIPVIGNGNIFDAHSAEQMFKKTGVDGIMLARGTFGNPGLFQEILETSGENTTTSNPSTDLINILLRHYQLSIEEYGEKLAIFKMRKVAQWYLNRLENTDDLKKKILKSERFEEIEKLVKKS